VPGRTKPVRARPPRRARLPLRLERARRRAALLGPAGPAKADVGPALRLRYQRHEVLPSQRLRHPGAVCELWARPSTGF
jgi:hypothetical protein